MNVSKKIYELEKKIKDLQDERDSIKNLYESLNLEIEINSSKKFEFVESILYQAQLKIDQGDDYVSAYNFLIENIWDI